MRKRVHGALPAGVAATDLSASRPHVPGEAPQGGSLARLPRRLVLVGCSGHLSTRRILPAVERMRRREPWLVTGVDPSPTQAPGIDRLVSGSATEASTWLRAFAAGVPDLVYFATPAHCYLSATQAMVRALGTRRPPIVCYEKPFGVNAEATRALRALTEARGIPTRLVDHYLFKRALRAAHIHFGHAASTEHLADVRFTLFERAGLTDRTSPFEAAGGILGDVVQNHALSSVAYALAVLEGRVPDAGARCEMITRLRLSRESVVGGQYAGATHRALASYRDESGRWARPSTDTFIAFKGRIRGTPSLWHVRCGKRMPIDRSALSLVFAPQRPAHVPHRIWLSFRPESALLVQEREGAPIDRIALPKRCEYDDVLASALAGRGDFFASWEETLVGWRMTSRVASALGGARQSYPNYVACEAPPSGDCQSPLNSAEHALP